MTTRIPVEVPWTVRGELACIRVMIGASGLPEVIGATLSRRGRSVAVVLTGEERAGLWGNVAFLTACVRGRTDAIEEREAG